MSIRLMSLVWDIPFPTQGQKIIALALADYAADAGGSVFPARDTLAQKCGCDESTVKRTLRAFRDCGILSLIREGGNGPKDTNEWSLNVPLLRALAEQTCKLVGGSRELALEGDLEAVDNPENKGGQMTPLLSTRGAPGPLRGATDTPKGVPRAPQSVTNHQIEPSLRASAREGENFIDGSEVKKPEPQFTITPADPQWPNWIEFLRSKNPDDATAAETAGQIVTTAKWASNGRVLHIPRLGLTERSKAMQGETA